MTSSKKWGVGCLITPFAGLALVLILWSITSFVIGQYVATGPVMNTGAQAMAAIINLVLGFLGLIFVILIPVGLIVGIVLLVKKENASEQTPITASTAPAKEVSSEQKEQTAVPPVKEDTVTPPAPITSEPQPPVQPETPPTPEVQAPPQTEKPAEPPADKPQEPTPGQNQ